MKTFANMKRYVEHCKKKNPFLWSKCIHKRGKNKFVSIDDLCQDFIRPQTKDVNSCIALNMKSVLGKDFEILYLRKCLYHFHGMKMSKK